MATVFFDIETIPDQREGAKERFIKESRDNFKAPSSMTKGQAAKDLGRTDAEVKFIGKDDLIAEWVEHFAPIKADAVGIDNWRKTGLDGAQGEVFSIAWGVGNEPIEGLYREPDASEAAFLTEVFKRIHSACNEHQPFFVGNYIAGFDLKFLFKRAVILGVKPPFDLKFDGRHDQHFYDLQQGWEGFNGRASLDSMCKALGIPGKPDDIDGSKVWDFVERGDFERVMQYNILDVDESRQVYKRLTFTS